MSDWKADLDGLMAEAMAFVRNVDERAPRPSPQARETARRTGIEPIDWVGAEREEIRKRVEIFKAHQQRFIREREEFAAKMVLRMRAVPPG